MIMIGMSVVVAVVIVCGVICHGMVMLGVFVPGTAMPVAHGTLFLTLHAHRQSSAFF
jgi:hypothetical protein